MANCLFGFPIYSDANQTYVPTFSGGSWSGSLPLTNLSDRRLAQVARSTNATLANTQFDADLKPARGIRLCALPKHNLSIAARIRIRGSSSTAFTGNNLLLRSEEFNTGWTLGNVTVNANATTAPDGAATADKILDTAVNSTHYAQQNVTVVAGNPYTFSCYVKAAERTQAGLLFYGGTGSLLTAYINLSTGAILSQSAGISDLTVTADGSWWRVSFTATPGTTTAECYVTPAVGGTHSYLGDGASGIYAWGAQLEAGSTVGVYQITTTATVTGSTVVYFADWTSVYGSIYPTGTIPTGHPSYTTRIITAEELLEQRAAGINYGFVKDFGAHYPARYWRIEIDDTTNAAGYVELGRLVLAAAWQPSINPVYGVKLGYETSSSRTETDGGAAIYDERPRRRIVNGAIERLPEDEAMVSVLDMQKYHGTTRQLFFVFDPSDTSHMHRRSFLAVPKSIDPLDFPYPLYNAAPFALVEEL